MCPQMFFKTVTFPDLVHFQRQIETISEAPKFAGSKTVIVISKSSATEVHEYMLKPASSSNWDNDCKEPSVSHQVCKGVQVH